MKKTLIENVTVITSNNNTDEIFENISVVIEDNKITDFGNHISKNRSHYDEIIDGNDGFLLPGFIDAHVHLMADGFRNENTMNNPLSYYFYKGLKSMKNTIDAGVTTVRDCGLVDIGVKRAVDEKIFPAPKMKICVVPLSITGGHFDFYLNSGHDMMVQYPGFPHPVCDGVEGILSKTREVIRAKADFVKIMATGGVISANDGPEDTQFNVKELKIAVDEAKRSYRKVATHCHGLGGIKNSVKAGVHSIEHGTFIDRKTAKEVAKKGIFLVPTFTVINFQKQQAINRELTTDKIPKALEIGKVHRENIEIAYEEGIKMAMGTDNGVSPHGDNLKELEYFIDLGMSPMEVIKVGTINGAKCLEIDNQTGSIEKGKLGDLIITNKNPLENISNLTSKNNIKFVMQDGIIVKNNLAN